MRLSRCLLLVVLGVSLANSPPTRAQGVAPGRLRLALEETDRRIELAEAAISSPADAQARGELARARDLQVRARSAAAAGRPFVAGQLSLEARGHADRAMALVRGLPGPEGVAGQLESTREMLDRAGERIEACGDERARAVLGVALELQERAESAEQARRHLGALQLTMGARERLLRALRLCRLEENVQETAERALRRTEQVLARARDLLGSGAPGRGARALGEALPRASALQDDAARQFRAGHYETSLQLTLTARRLAHRAAGRGARAF